jgi:hypothetical protein
MCSEITTYVFVWQLCAVKLHYFYLFNLLLLPNLAEKLWIKSEECYLKWITNITFMYYNTGNGDHRSPGVSTK